MLLGEHEALLPRGPYQDPYVMVKQLRAGNINDSEDRDYFQELFALTSSPSSEILECAPSSHPSPCSSRSFSPHTPLGSPPSSLSSSSSNMDHDSEYRDVLSIPPPVQESDMHGTEQPVHINSALVYEDDLSGFLPSYSVPGRPLGLGLCCPVVDAPVSCFNHIYCLISSQLWCSHY